MYETSGIFRGLVLLDPYVTRIGREVRFCGNLILMFIPSNVLTIDFNSFSIASLERLINTGLTFLQKRTLVIFGRVTNMHHEIFQGQCFQFITHTDQTSVLGELL